MLVVQSKKTDYDTKTSETKKKILDYNHGQYITTQEINNLTADNFAARFKEATLATKDDIVDFVKKTNFDNKLKNFNIKLL